MRVSLACLVCDIIPIDYYSRSFELGSVTRDRPPHSLRMFFTFSAVEGLEGVAKWLEVYNKYRPVTDILLSPVYRPPWYFDHHFFDALTATETLVRIRIDKQNFNLKEELLQLAKYAGPTFESLVGDIDGWAKLVVQTRIKHLMHRGREGDEGHPPIYELTESLYFLVVFSLLRECDVPDRVFQDIEQHQRFHWLQRDLGEALCQPC